ncbi:MAG: NAD-dependent epimerase/dehydratase family protein [Deltaproteobacteria bacterium]
MNYNYSYTGKKVLITGGLGMIGSNLAVKLTALGAEVSIIDAMLPMYGGNFANIEEIKDKLFINVADIRDASAVNYLVQGMDLIFNLAAQVSYTDSQTDPLLDLDINCKGHLLLLEACRKYNPDVKIVFSGSRLEYGAIEGSEIVTEAHPLRPKSFYGIHKVVGEFYHQMYFKLHGIRTVCFRIANPYGIRHHMKHSKYGIVNYFIRKAMDGETIEVFGDGSQLRDYIYVEDIVDAMIVAGVTSEADGEVFNLGSGLSVSFFIMAETVVDLVGSGAIRKVPWPENYRIIEGGDFECDISKAREVLKWQPDHSLKDGIIKTVAYYNSRRSSYW